MTTGVHHVALTVRDLQRVEHFYRDVLGLAVLRRQEERSVWLDLGGGAFLALEHGVEGVGADDKSSGWHLVALRITVADRQLWTERLTQAGFAIYQRTPFTIYVRDPEGNRVGLSHFPEPADADHHV